MPAGLELAPLLTKLQVDTKSFEKDMQKAAERGRSEADKINKSLSNLEKSGMSLERAGASLTKYVTLPIAGVGIAAAKMAVDFETDFAKVSTLLDSTVVDFDKYKDSLLKGSNETKVAITDYSEAVYQAISAGVDQTKAVEFTTQAMKLAKGGFTSGASAVDILTTAINGYNLKSEDATKLSDMLITTQNLGKTTVNELAESMGKVIPIASSVNFGMDELSASYAQLTKNGIATAEAGTYMKQMLSELGKTGTATDKALREMTGRSFAQLKAEGTSTSEILNMLSGYAEQSGMTLKDMFGSVEAGSAALVLSKGSGEEYNAMLQSMQTSAGATQAAFEKMDATPAEQLKGALNELKNSGIELGAAFVPIITEIAENITHLARGFNNLSEKQKENIIQWAGIAMAVGPVISLLGKGVTTYTKLSPLIGGVSKALGSLATTSAVTATSIGGTTTAVGGATAVFGGLTAVCAPMIAGIAAAGIGLYALHENSQLMKRSVMDASDEMSGMEKVLAKLQGVEIRSRKEMENLGLIHEEFSEDISPEFQKEVEKSCKKVQDFNVYIRELGFDGVISPEESAEFNARVDNTCNEAINTIQSKAEQSQAALKKLFVADDNVIDEGEQKVLDILSKSSKEQITQVQNLQKEILEIKQRALEEGRSLNEQEIANIEAKNSSIRQIELEALGGTQEEILYAKNEFAARAKNIDVEGASQLLQEKAKVRDEEILAIKASYDTEIDMLKSKYSECSTEERAALDEQIANLEADKQTKIQKQNELFDSYLDIIRENNPKLLNEIDEYNGKVLTNEDLNYQERLYNMMSHYDGLNQITESGCYQIYNKEAGMWQNMRVAVDGNTGAIVGIYNEATTACGGYTEKMAQDAQNMADRQTGSYTQIGSSMGLYIDCAGNVRGANDQMVVSMDQLKNHTDGTRQGIADINGTPYNITVNTDGTISALQQISAEASAAAQDRYMTIHISSAFADNPSVMAYNGVKGDKYGWHYNGLENVPYDGYRAILHKGERVMTAEENEVYSVAAQTQKAVPEQLTAVIQIGTREVEREIIKIANDGMGKLNARRI